MKYTNNLAMLAIAFIATLALPSAHAFWRMECRARSGFGRIDPLMSPGELSAHAHTIHGSSGFGPSSGYDDLMAGDCTSCAVSEDKSAYWTPALYFQSSDGKFTLVNQVGGMLSYYFLNPAPGQTKITAFPKGFQMIAGDTYRRNFTLQVPDPPQSSWSSIEGQTTQEGLAMKALGFNCLNYGRAPEGSLTRHFMPDKSYLDANCADGIRVELMFPTCWNNKDLDSPDHKSHVAYPDLVINGNCPDEFPTRFPGLFYETIWDTNAFRDQAGQFVFANGDPTGYGYHGDFIMGWDETLLQNAVDTCTDPSGRIQDCPLFTEQGSDIYGNCNFTTSTMQSAIANVFESEDNMGPLANLPGHVAIQSGPGYAKPLTTGAPAQTVDQTGAPVPTLSYSPGFTASASDSVIPGAIFIATTTTGDSSTAEPTTTPIAAPVVAPAVTPAAKVVPEVQSDTPYTTVYSTSGREVIEMVMYEETVTIDETSTTTVYNKARRHMHDHRRRHI